MRWGPVEIGRADPNESNYAFVSFGWRHWFAFGISWGRRDA